MLNRAHFPGRRGIMATRLCLDASLAEFSW